MGIAYILSALVFLAGLQVQAAGGFRIETQLTCEAASLGYSADILGQGAFPQVLKNDQLSFVVLNTVLPESHEDHIRLVQYSLTGDWMYSWNLVSSIGEGAEWEVFSEYQGKFLRCRFTKDVKN